MQILLPCVRLLPFHLEIHPLLPNFTVGADTGQELVNIFPLPVEGAGETWQKKGSSVSLGWLLCCLRVGLCNSEPDTQWGSPSACPFWRQPGSTCTPAGGFLSVGMHFPAFWPQSSACGQLCSRQPIRPLCYSLGYVYWATSTPSPTKSGSYFWKHFFQKVCFFLGESPSTIGYSLAFFFISF